MLLSLKLFETFLLNQLKFENLNFFVNFFGSSSIMVFGMDPQHINPQHIVTHSEHTMILHSGSTARNDNISIFNEDYHKGKGFSVALAFLKRFGDTNFKIGDTVVDFGVDIKKILSRPAGMLDIHKVAEDIKKTLSQSGQAVSDVANDLFLNDIREMLSNCKNQQNMTPAMITSKVYDNASNDLTNDPKTGKQYYSHRGTNFQKTVPTSRRSGRDFDETDHNQLNNFSATFDNCSSENVANNLRESGSFERNSENLADSANSANSDVTKLSLSSDEILDSDLSDLFDDLDSVMTTDDVCGHGISDMDSEYDAAEWQVLKSRIRCRIESDKISAHENLKAESDDNVGAPSSNENFNPVGNNYTVNFKKFLERLEAQGILRDDPRLRPMMKNFIIFKKMKTALDSVTEDTKVGDAAITDKKNQQKMSPQTLNEIQDRQKSKPTKKSTAVDVKPTTQCLAPTSRVNTHSTTGETLTGPCPSVPTSSDSSDLLGQKITAREKQREKQRETALQREEVSALSLSSGKMDSTNLSSKTSLQATEKKDFLKKGFSKKEGKSLLAKLAMYLKDLCRGQSEHRQIRRIVPLEKTDDPTSSNANTAPTLSTNCHQQSLSTQEQQTASTSKLNSSPINLEKEENAPAEEPHAESESNFIRNGLPPNAKLTSKSPCSESQEGSPPEDGINKIKIDDSQKKKIKIDLVIKIQDDNKINDDKKTTSVAENHTSTTNVAEKKKKSHFIGKNVEDLEELMVETLMVEDLEDSDDSSSASLDLEDHWTKTVDEKKSSTTTLRNQNQKLLSSDDGLSSGIGTRSTNMGTKGTNVSNDSNFNTRFELSFDEFMVVIDPCLYLIKEALDIGTEEEKESDSLNSLISSVSGLTSSLIIPDFPKFRNDIFSIFENIKNDVKLSKEGKMADYIPQLAQQNPDHFAIGICTVDGQRCAFGDCSQKFCLQSCSKTGTYCMALEAWGSERVHQHVGVEPSGTVFNALIVNPRGLPHNPLLNSGAIMTSSLNLAFEAQNEAIEKAMAQSERSHRKSHRKGPKRSHRKGPKRSHRKSHTSIRKAPKRSHRKSHTSM